MTNHYFKKEHRLIAPRLTEKFFTLFFFLLIFAFTFPVFSEPLKGPLETGWNNQKVCEKLSENAHETILRCTFPPQTGHEKHQHNANFGYALAGGKMQISDEKGTRVVHLKTGSYFNSPGTSWHHAVNVGETTIIYLIVESKYAE